MGQAMSRYSIGSMLLLCVALPSHAADKSSASKGRQLKIRVRVTSVLPKGLIPIDPLLDFDKMIRQQGATGNLDPNSIEVRDARGQPIPHSLGKQFRYGGTGRVRWLAKGPNQTRFEIRFRSVAQRPLLLPRARTPLIGVGDLLRYNTGRPMQIALRFPSRLVDMNGDGQLDLVGTQTHLYSPRSPRGGICCFPQVPGATREFGDMVRLRFRAGTNRRLPKTATGYRHFIGPYMVADVADLNRDGLPDLVYTTTARTARFQPDREIHKFAHFYLNTGRKDAGGMPEFRFASKVPLPADPDYRWGPVRLVDLNGDGALDLTVGRMFEDQGAIRPSSLCYYMQNLNRKGWPLKLAPPTTIDAGRRGCFYDVDGDGRLDCVGLTRDPNAETIYRGDRITWRRNLGGDPPRFGRRRNFPGQDLRFSTFVSAVDTPSLRGLIFNDKRNHGVSLLEQPRRGVMIFRRSILGCRSAHVVAGDQASPYPSDWDNDGDWDLVVGGGNGWPQVLRNTGSNAQPVFDMPRQIPANGKPIRIFMSQVFPGIAGYGHDMGYPFPSHVDWDGDGRADLMMPNITNRVFWYRNTGSKTSPNFTKREQITIDGHPETKQTLAATAKLLGAGTRKWNKRMMDPNSPFGWRARAAFGDFNGDGLMDMVHADGRTRNRSGYADRYALFLRYRDNNDQLRLKRDSVVTLPDGKPLKAPGGITSQVIAADWDADGRLDLICHFGPSNTSCMPMFVRNIGTKAAPKFDHPRPLKLWGKPLFNLMKHGPYWTVHDIDGDGRLDLLAGCAYGNYAFYRRTAMEMKARPTIVMQIRP